MPGGTTWLEPVPGGTTWLPGTLTGSLSLPAGGLKRIFWASKQLQRREAVDDAMVAKGIYRYLVTIAAALGR